MGKDDEPCLIVLTLEPAKGWPTDWSVRMRRLLKATLRAYGFRCVTIAYPDQASSSPQTKPLSCS